MPFLFKEGLVFMPGDLALYKPDENEEGKPCTVNDLISGENNVLEVYKITLDQGDVLFCAIDELRLRPEK
ncbi:MAG: hypothetical protein PHE15_01900 [Dehalococcoidales bacterium]|nr:hypothetical protein [Dehalococcoidales bacterium]